MSQHPIHHVRQGVRRASPVGKVRIPVELHRLQWNENPIDFPADLKEEVVQRLLELEWSRYPTSGRPWPLIERLAAHWAVGPAQVVVGPGSADLIKLIMAATLSPGDTVVMPVPTFLLYRMHAHAFEARTIEIPLQPEAGWALPVEQLIEESMTLGAKLVALCAPNNPTGTIYGLDELEFLVAGSNSLVVIDAAYAEFCRQDLTPLLAHENVILVHTLSKAYAMAGIRVGYALTSPPLAAEFQKLVTAFPISVFGEAAALVALDNTARFMTARDAIVAERERLRAALTTIPGATAYPSGTNFLLIQLDRPKQGLLEHLRKQHGVLISDMAAYPELTNCVRVSVGTPAQNDLVIRAFQEHLLG